QEEVARSAAERGLSAASVARACGLLAARPALSVDAALSAAERGESATGAPAPVAMAGPQKIAPRPKADEGIDEDRELWGDEAVTDDDLAQAAREKKRPSAVDAAFGDTITADGNRVFRIHTVDAFCDEVGRIA